MAGLIFRALELTGVVLVGSIPVPDERGSFGRTFDEAAFRERGLPVDIVQESVSRNARAHTLRGLHGTLPARPEAKYVSCTRGRIFDVIVDARPGSASFGRWVSIELDEERDEQLFIPAGYLHGFQTLRDETVVRYRMMSRFDPGAFAGAHFASPGFGIRWPAEPSIVSARDLALPRL
jgi:dTDP-4-dehydrorhamnose 3,5-epimerase